MDNPEPFESYGPMRSSYGRMYSSLDFDDVSISYCVTIKILILL